MITFRPSLTHDTATKASVIEISFFILLTV
jgi:hypothetical protein